MPTTPPSPISLLAARACELSYDDFSGDTFNKGIVDLGFSDVCTIDVAGVQAFCAANAKVLLVCFRGTDSKADWLADAMAAKVNYGYDHKVHTGFLRTLKVIDQQVKDFILPRAKYFQPRTLIITGHSLGAGMATLFASNMFVEPDYVITFGSPRVGDAAFCKWFNDRFADRSIRYVNNNDAVTRLPLKSMGYVHVWRQFYFDRTGQLHIDYKPKPLRKWWDSFSGILRNLRRLKIGDGISDHSMHDYRHLVERTAGVPPAPRTAQPAQPAPLTPHASIVTP